MFISALARIRAWLVNASAFARMRAIACSNPSKTEWESKAKPRSGCVLFGSERLFARIRAKPYGYGDLQAALRSCIARLRAIITRENYTARCSAWVPKRFRSPSERSAMLGRDDSYTALEKTASTRRGLCAVTKGEVRSCICLCGCTALEPGSTVKAKAVQLRFNN